jgi:tetratricopeptide (TPR) repeat protein
MKRSWIAAGVVAAFLACAPGAVQAQSELELAQYYFDEGSFEQARLYLEVLWRKNKTNQVYDLYYGTLLGLNDFEGAESLVLSRIRNRQARSTGYVDLGKLYLHFGKRDEAMAAFRDALEQLEPGRGYALQLANAFIALNELDLAYEVYRRAMAAGVTDLDMQLANLQGMRGDFPGMVDAYFEVLRAQPAQLRNVTAAFERSLRIGDNPEHGDMLLAKLTAAATRSPELPVYDEVFLWYFSQLKDFPNALVHARALDRRLGENGVRLMELAATAAENGDETTARASYSAVAAKGLDSPYYFTARTEALQIELRAIEQRRPVDRGAAGALAADYEAALAELGVRPETATLVRDLAHLEAFLLGRTAPAIDRLTALLADPALYARVAAECKVELADIYVFSGEVWDAALLYGQVDLDYKDDPLGHEARYRNARISYFTGDFAWAQTQLDALKASTSKLISNDAIDLSLLISDNFALDTVTAPMELFAQADLLALQHRYAESRALLDSLSAAWPGHALSDEILWRRADLATAEGRDTAAIPFLEEIIALHFTDILADDALFRLAVLREDLLGDTEAALKLYERLLFEFPGSLHGVEARRRFRALRGES